MASRLTRVELTRKKYETLKYYASYGKLEKLREVREVKRSYGKLREFTMDPKQLLIGTINTRQY